MARVKTQAALAAAAIKKHLKAQGIACKVKSDNFSMGSSVDIYVDNLLSTTLDLVKTYCEQYEYGAFDSMTDCQETKNIEFDGPQAKYVTVNCSYSDEYYQAAWSEAKAKFSAMDDAPEHYTPSYYDYDHSRIFTNVFNDMKSDFWTQFKPRLAA